MLFTTPTQWLALAVALIAGWLFGLASHPGGRKWKQRYADERDVNGRSRKDFDLQITQRETRIKELERENDRLARATPVVTTPHATNAPLVGNRTDGRPVSTTRGRWFDWNNRVGPLR